MTKYIVKVAFWLRAYDSADIAAMFNLEAVEKAREVAVSIMNAPTRPEEIDLESRCAGVIAYVERVGVKGRITVVEDLAFFHANSEAPAHKRDQS